ncbi:hypothetical protein CHS0354_000521 [Potamilus streckersoni]|uniref:BIG2 domain-containing protein n=1 Tax=Potamilus streckersoni TaxID=2493646 RepID=A0AAE0W8C8_9BIVA|nr:hypothetical protein CHS0354_000521 [Potamilus streckersoni]
MNISPVGRVEGDLDVRVHIEGNKVIRAHTQAAMFRGFEKIMEGKDYQSGLIVTPRICGICGGSHLYCASSALDTAMRTTLPPNALLLRAIGQCAETLQSIPRWFYAIFATDMCNKKFKDKSLYAEVCKRWAAYTGKHFQIGVTASGRPVEVYALFGGQWPHSSYMVPGGVMCAPTLHDITRAYSILNQFKNDWLESVFLGCTVERYMQIKSWDDLMAWVEEKESHRNSDLGLFIRAGQEFGLDTFGQGCGKYMAYGTYIHKDMWNTPTIESRNKALISPSGYYDGRNFHEFNHLKITEHVKHSWYQDYPATHPWDEPMPDPLKSTSLEHSDFDKKYSWSKSPRYDDSVVEVGPLARVIMAGNPSNLSHQIRDPLFVDIMKKKGPSVFVRTLGRLHEEPKLFSLIRTWLGEVKLDDEFYIKPKVRDGKGWGATEAARGALAHWVEIEGGKIKNYQVVAPTTFNVGPNDEKGRSGPIESALTGIEIADPTDPVEVGECAQPTPKYIVTLNANCGIAGNTTTIEVESGKTATAPVSLPTRTSYVLLGWNTKEEGTGTAFVFGTTIVTANITIYAMWTVIPVTSIAFDKTTLTTLVGRTTQLTAIVVPDNALNKTLIWTSSNTVVAIVSTTGLITAVSGDTTTITATSTDGTNKSASITVTVNIFAFTVTELKKTGDVRPNYVAFSISHNDDLTTYTDYTLALVKSSVAKPTAAQMVAGYTYKRNISSTTMNLMLWADLTSNFQSRNNGATLTTSLLTTNTSYKLYGLKNGGGDTDVKELKTFTTDAVPSSATAVNLDASIYASPRPNFTLRRNERFVWIVNGVAIRGAGVEYSEVGSGIALTLCVDGLCIPSDAPDWNYSQTDIGNSISRGVASRRTDIPTTTKSIEMLWAHDGGKTQARITFVFE